MSLPILEKTWQYSLNLQNAIAGDGVIDIKDIFIQMKDAMVGFGSSPWTVVGSCNSGSANMSGTDLLIVPGDIVHPTFFGPQFSWIVLEQPGWNSGAQVCFSFSAAGNYSIDVTFSLGGLFAGGTTTARPTATDEVVIGVNEYWISDGAEPDRQYVVHVMQSTDGACTRILGCHSGLVSCYMAFENIANPIDGWPQPAVAEIISIGNNAAIETLMDMAFWYGGTWSPSIFSNYGWGWWGVGASNSTLRMKLGTEWHAGNNPFVFDNYANEISGEFPLTPIGIDRKSVV